MVFDEVRSSLEKALSRLAELRLLSAGWHDGAGKQLTREALQTAEQFFVIRPALSGLYSIFPTEPGGILVDFEHKGWDWSLEFAPSGKVEMYGIEVDGDQEMEPVEFATLDALLDEFDRRTSIDG